MITIKQMAANRVIVLGDGVFDQYTTHDGFVYPVNAMGQRLPYRVGERLQMDAPAITATPGTLLEVIRRERKRAKDASRRGLFQ